MTVWEYFREPYQLEMLVGKTATFYRDGIRRKDGFTLIKLFTCGNDPHHYWCRGDFGEFRFIASRWDVCKEVLTEQYTVYPDRFDPKWPGDEKTNQALCLAHLKEIETALLCFPTVFYFDFIPEVQDEGVPNS